MTQFLFSSPLTCQSYSDGESNQDELNRAYRIGPFPSQTVCVELQTNAVEDDGSGYPVPIDSQVLQVNGPRLTREAVEVALHSLIDLSKWTIAQIWQPAGEGEF
jgi:hypothetical protein